MVRSTKHIAKYYAINIQAQSYRLLTDKITSCIYAEENK